MKSEITQEKPRIVNHRKHRLEVIPSKEVEIWRGLDKKTYNYILTNRYYDDTILVLNGLDFMVELRRRKFPDNTISAEKVKEIQAVMSAKEFVLKDTPI